jgi:hypothetical protein
MVETKCIHGRRKRSCVECDGSAICIHKIRKERCEECGGSALCEHKIEKYKCFKCKGGIFCIHDKRKERCDECIKLLFCEHNNRKATCEQCKAERTCEHEKTRDKCNICNPSYYHCIHGITKHMCKQCGGSAWCSHGKYKSRCKLCNGSALCKSEWCDKLAIKKYNGYCLTCCIYLCPDIEVIRNYKTKEKNVVENIINYFPDFSWVADKRIQDGCSFRRPDLLLDLGTHIIIVEIDEYKHEGYECSCENKRIMELSQDANHRPIVFIRFNPDGYIDQHGTKITTCWKQNGLGVITLTKTKVKEWDNRIKCLLEQIQYWIDNPCEKTIEIIELYYDGM